MSTESEHIPNVSKIAHLLMPIDRQFSWLNEDIFVTEQENNDIDEFNKKYTDLKPINKNIAVDAYVYIHIGCKYNEKIPNEIVMCIIDFWNIKDSYFEILCDKNQHLIHKNDTQELSLFGHNINTIKCENCSNKYCLEFKKSYNGDLHPNQRKFCHTYMETMDMNNTMNTFTNIGNEYQCRKCKYYTLFNVKMKVISYHLKYERDIMYHYVTPFKPKKDGKYTNYYNDVNKDVEMERNWIKCGECKNKFVIIVQFNYSEIKTKNIACKTSSDYIYYCNVCDLVTHKGHKDKYSTDFKL